MGRTNDNTTEARKKEKKLHFFDGRLQPNTKIYFGKPSSDFYIDDKNLNFKSGLSINLKN